MKGLLWLLALFALAVGVSLAAYVNDGYVLFVLPPYRAEISLNLAVLLLVGGFATLYAFLRGAALTLSLPRRVREFRERRKSEARLDAFREALRLLFEGRYGHALKKAVEAYEAGRPSALAALLAARAAQHLHDAEKQKTWLDRAVGEDSKMLAASLMLEAEMLVDEGRFDEAIERLKRLHDLAGKHAAALHLELRAHEGRGCWDEALRVARQLEKHHAFPSETLQEIERKMREENARRLQAPS